MVSIHFQLIIALVGLQGVLATLEYRPHVSNLAPWPCEVAATSTVRNPKWCPIDNLKKNHGKLSMNQGYLKISVDHTIGNKLVSLWVGFRIICLCFLMCYIYMCSFGSSHLTLIPCLSISCLLFISASKVLPEPWKGQGRFRKDEVPMTWVSCACFGAPGWWCLSFRKWNKIQWLVIIIP